MTATEGRAILNKLYKRGHVRVGNRVYTPAEAAVLSILETTKPSTAKNKVVKTGWIDDIRNIKNRDKYSDMFDMLLKIETGLQVWNEFYFLTDKGYRFDKAIPVTSSNSISLKISVEIDGGVWSKGASGHSSGTGILRDQDKSTLAAINGWILIRTTPGEIKNEPGKIIDLIKKAVETRGIK